MSPLAALGLAAALAESPDPLPSPQALRGQIAALERSVVQADVVFEALALAHNALGERLATGGAPGCDDAPAMDLVARAEALGPAYAAALQTARADARRVQAMAETPSGAPLAQGLLAPELAALSARVATHEGRYVELAGWHAARVQPLARRCAPALAPGPGLEGDRALRGARGEVAVIVLDPGAAPPDGALLWERVWLVPVTPCEGSACAARRPAAVWGDTPSPIEEVSP